MWNPHPIEPEALAESSAIGPLTGSGRRDLLLGEAEGGRDSGQDFMEVGELAEDFVIFGVPELLGLLVQLRDERGEVAS
jgi:hypothetical protein